MNSTKLSWLALVPSIIAVAIAIGCSKVGTPPLGNDPQEEAPFSRSLEMSTPAEGSKSYTTRELALKEVGYPTAFWEGKIVYDATTKSGEKDVGRIIQHDLATGLETILVEANPPHTDAKSLHRSGDWLFFYETHTAVARGVPSVSPRDFYAINLRTGQRQHLAILERADWYALSGSAFGENGVAYLTSNDGRLQLRVYNIESGEDRLLLEKENSDTSLWSPMLSGSKAIFSQGWQTEWPPDIIPTPILGRPGPPPRYQRTGDIFSIDLNTGETVNLSKTGSASQPAIWGDYLMWIDSPGSQEHGSGEVYIQNGRTGQLKKLTSDATYLHLYSSPEAGDGFFVWGDGHRGKDKLPVYLAESAEIVYLEGPGGEPDVHAVQTDGNTLFWSWQDTATPESGAVDGGSRKVYMTTFE